MPLLTWLWLRRLLPSPTHSPSTSSKKESNPSPGWSCGSMKSTNLTINHSSWETPSMLLWAVILTAHTWVQWTKIYFNQLIPGTNRNLWNLILKFVPSHNHSKITFHKCRTKMERKGEVLKKGAIAKKANAWNYIATASETIKNVRDVHVLDVIILKSSIWKGIMRKSFWWIEILRLSNQRLRVVHTL